VIGGVGSFTFGRHPVKATRITLPTAPHGFPESLQDFAKPDPGFGEAACGVAKGGESAVKDAAVGAAGAVAARFRRKGARAGAEAPGVERAE
jgi:hypothetical protein